MKIKNFLRQLYLYPPKTILRKTKNKIFGNKKNKYSIVEVIDSPKYMRSQRMTDYFLRYQRIINRKTDKWQLDFQNKKVLEIGCGPLLGWAPLAVFLGCNKYVGIEPLYNVALLEHPKVQTFFLLNYKDLMALFGERMSFNDFQLYLKKRVTIYKESITNFFEEDGFEVVLSHSCFEHINDLDVALKRLKEITVKNAVYLHAVDFGNHRGTTNPFEGIYNRTPPEYFKEYGKHINLLRNPNILNYFAKHNFDVQMLPYYSYPESFADGIVDWWLKRYTKEDLFLKVAFYINKI